MTDDELTKKEVKQMEAGDQAIQIILMDILEDIYVVVDSCETAQEIWLRAQQMMKECQESGCSECSSDLGVQNVGKLNGLIVVSGIANPNANQNGNDNVVPARAKGNGNGNNENQIRCYNCRGLGHLARNCTQESTSGTQIDNAPIYDSDGSAEVHEYDNCYNNEIFNMFTQEEQYTELLEPIPDPLQVQHNDSNVNYAVSSMEQSGGTIEQNPATIEETLAEVPSASALQVLRRLGSIFTSVYAVVQKLKKDSWLELQFSLADNSKLNIVYLLNRS
ncbi:retrovirus-related pol polyprotein from transposon TNT 1-94 [Tanacetum coccineum]